MFSRRTACLSFLSLAAVAYGQAAQDSTKDRVLDKLVLQVKAQVDAAHRVSIVTNAGNFAGYIVAFTPNATSTMTPAFHVYEEQRLDKKVSRGGTGVGT